MCISVDILVYFVFSFKKYQIQTIIFQYYSVSMEHQGHVRSWSKSCCQLFHFQGGKMTGFLCYKRHLETFLTLLTTCQLDAAEDFEGFKL